MALEADARRLKLLEELASGTNGRDLGEFARLLGADDRTIRRDVEFLQDLVPKVERIDIRRGKIHAARTGFGPGYFSDQVVNSREPKEAIARRIVDTLPSDLPIVLTAGTTVYYVARELKRAASEENPPHGVIAFTNSLPALLELISAGISTGIIGEAYDPDDCAFYSHDLRSAFHPSVAIVGASGVVADARRGTLDLFSHRADEAAFMQQLLIGVPEIVIAVDSSKIGRRHPWSFSGGRLLEGKTVRLVTNNLEQSQRAALAGLTGSCELTFAFQFEEH